MNVIATATIDGPEAKGNATHKLWLCRGENVANNPIQPIPEIS
mgnify:CR=1 FL=1